MRPLASVSNAPLRPLEATRMPLKSVIRYICRPTVSKPLESILERLASRLASRALALGRPRTHQKPIQTPQPCPNASARHKAVLGLASVCDKVDLCPWFPSVASLREGDPPSPRYGAAGARGPSSWARRPEGGRPGLGKAGARNTEPGGRASQRTGAKAGGRTAEASRGRKTFALETFRGFSGACWGFSRGLKN